MITKQDILGVEFTSARKNEILEEVFNMLRNKDSITIVTPNPEIIVYAKKHNSYKEIINNAQISLPDGVGVLLAAKIMGKSLKERITGVDFMEDLCRKSSEKNVSMGFLGGRPGVAERAAECLMVKYPGMDVVFVGSEWSEAGYDAAELLPRTNQYPSYSGVSNKSNKTYRTHESYGTARHIDILFVAFGAPKQEEWIAEHLNKIPVKAAMGVGGAFDYFSGEVMRAPAFVRTAGLEWLYRLIRQPWRWKRQLALVEFVWLVLEERFKLKS